MALERALDALGVPLAREQVEKLLALSRLLRDWNARLNLTSITDPVEVELKHLADSLAPSMQGWLPLSGQRPRTLLDVGSGAGFPALPLAIAHPDVSVTALEKTRKKAEFIELAADSLDLDVRVLRARAEEEGRRDVRREKFDLVLARAVAYLPVLAEYCLPLTRPGGHFIAMKSEAVEEELADGIYAVEQLGGRLREPIPYSIPRLAGVRWLLVAEKVAHTPAEYPREPGVPRRRPLVAR